MLRSRAALGARAAGLPGVAVSLQGDEAVTSTTDLLQAWRAGDGEAFERLIPRVYEELRRLARAYLRGERPDHTLQPTALLHEAYLRVLEQRALDWQSRAHFVAVAARMMRRVLLNHARDRRTAKRGGGMAQIPLAAAPEPSAGDLEWLWVLSEALGSLARFSPRLGRLAELRLVAGFTVAETARYLGCSTPTVKRDWRLAKAWIRRRIAPEAEG